jgi:ferredoxin
VVDVLRGELIKRENRKEIKIERSFLTRNYSLHLNKKLCNGCGLCAEICPKEAIKELPASIVEGRLAKKPKIDFDTNANQTANSDAKKSAPLKQSKCQPEAQKMEKYLK